MWLDSIRDVSQLFVGIFGSNSSLEEDIHDRPKELPLAALVGVLLIMQALAMGYPLCFVLIIYMWHLFLNVHLFFLVKGIFVQAIVCKMFRSTTKDYTNKTETF